jgi:hypothetical protein
MTTRRFRPVARTAGVEEGLAARLSDPLWMLARQWQFGEFRGDDAGSAVSVSFTGTAVHPTWWRPEPEPDAPGALPWEPWSVADGPLERRIEAEPDTGTAWTRLRLDGGVKARRMLLAAGLAELAPRLVQLAPWPADTPEATSPIDRVARGATPDGAALAALIQPWAEPQSAVPQEVSAVLNASPAKVASFAAAVRAWLVWWDARAAVTPRPAAPASADPVAWDPHRLEHRGTLGFAAAPTLRLRIDQYPGGGVDWFSADASTGQADDLPADPVAAPFDAPQPVSETSIPLPTSFAGMAAPRFWEFEDASVDYGSIDASPADLARLLLVQFTTVYGNDWFAIPVRLPVGALVRVSSVQVTDSFGGVHTLGPFAATSPGWRMYSLHAPADLPELAVDHVWCAPTLAMRLMSPPIERATLRRDEIANTAWAVVEQVTDDFGRIRNVPATAALLPPRTQPPQYVVATPVADNWFPLAPEPVGIDSIRLVLRALVRRGHGEIVESRAPGAVLAGNWWIHEEELGREGLTLDRRVKVGRWHDGTAHRWIGRGVWPGAGQAASGLLWDVVVE